ncbi:uncharacterized protein LOC128228872 [Mya arenaria]|uniref:uncharacterized protein LOC128228872 n=1 Tax=Mya arenaria TaxID=6604 RepID=UPI0022DEC685|nr:uncharacterized protein LOC128228872 [Mya arenaria]
MEISQLTVFLCLIYYCTAGGVFNTCLVSSVDQNGHPTQCGGIVGARCPSDTDDCPYLPNSDFGNCCVGCGPNVSQPTQKCRNSRSCGRRGRCVKAINNQIGLGVCCPSRPGGY